MAVWQVSETETLLLPTERREDIRFDGEFSVLGALTSGLCPHFLSRRSSDRLWDRSVSYFLFMFSPNERRVSQHRPFCCCSKCLLIPQLNCVWLTFTNTNVRCVDWSTSWNVVLWRREGGGTFSPAPHLSVTASCTTWQLKVHSYVILKKTVRKYGSCPIKQEPIAFPNIVNTTQVIF